MRVPGSLHTYTNATVVTPDGLLEQASIVVDGDRIAAAGHVTPRGMAEDLHGALVLPGFIDIHVHGGGGASFNTDDPDEVDAAVAFHQAAGTTRLLTSLVSDSVEGTLVALEAVGRSASRRRGVVIGAHLEGPFLSHHRPGCHDLVHLIDPDVGVLDRLLDQVPGLVSVMTVAPELTGAGPVIDRAVARGIQVGIGHSAADYDAAVAAFDRGVRIVTHAHNAMADVAHRQPGIVGAASQDPRSRLELIVDGIHVHDAVVAMTFAVAPRRVVLITDAAPAAGQPPGTFSHIGAAEVVVRGDGRITRRDSDVLAGSALTMEAAVRRAVQAGVSLVDAAHAAATAPAEALGLSEDLGSITAGRRADLVVLGHDLRVRQVVIDGHRRTSSPSGPAHVLAALQ